MFFKNKSSTDTPLNAVNLSRSERYLQATAGANGDFYVDIDGADGLANGDILRIAFPAATNPASNARLSINGVGGTYRNILSLTAKDIQEARKEVVYNGASWEIIGIKNIITCRLISNYTVVATNTYETLPVALATLSGNKLSVSGNLINIGAGVSRVLISYKVQYTSGTNGLKFISIFKNNTTQMSFANKTVAGTTPICSTPAIYDVTKGDQIYFKFYGTAGDIINGSGGNYLTYLTLEVIE